MADSYYKKIRRFCEANQISIPIGFRSGASRYAIILATDPPSLVARTWFNMEDVVYYIENLANVPPARILDFKDLDELQYTDGPRLKRVAKFNLP